MPEEVLYAMATIQMFWKRLVHIGFLESAEKR